MLKFGKLNKDCLMCGVDKRGNFFRDLTVNKTVNILWYFPLSKEKYKFKCDVNFVFSNEEGGLK